VNDNIAIPAARVQWRGKMKARVYVTMKPTVLDPQGQTICSVLQGMGHREIAGVRQGKYFEIALADGLSRDNALRMVDEVASDVLSNPVIEDYRLEILD
jgi:phosphoribosylformylglycinamidine synthase PurS subunit